ncbi:tandem-95_repeat protein [Hexamita inflata]|uniref:Tandem-95 repeat protein n=1 Tax=Hexamita inflata TaxID=28002 RepID=A0AA86PJJ5_9EUKA|nr:tandem-95 repeat protein [Hexamita inflata]
MSPIFKCELMFPPTQKLLAHTLNLLQQRNNAKEIYGLSSLRILNLSNCYLKQIDQIRSLKNLEVLDISLNQQVKIDSLSQLIKLKELNISWNKQMDIAPLKNLVGLIKLILCSCGIRSISVLKHLINLQFLDLSDNNLDITELQYLKQNLTYLKLNKCNLVSIYVLSPLVNLEYLNLTENQIVYLDSNLNQMKKLKEFDVQFNRISDFSSLEQHYNFTENRWLNAEIRNQIRNQIRQLQNESQNMVSITGGSGLYKQGTVRCLINIYLIQN